MALPLHRPLAALSSHEIARVEAHHPAVLEALHRSDDIIAHADSIIQTKEDELQRCVAMGQRLVTQLDATTMELHRLKQRVGAQDGDVIPSSIDERSRREALQLALDDALARAAHLENLLEINQQLLQTSERNLRSSDALARQLELKNAELGRDLADREQDLERLAESQELILETVATLARTTKCLAPPARLPLTLFDVRSICDDVAKRFLALDPLHEGSLAHENAELRRRIAQLQNEAESLVADAQAAVDEARATEEIRTRATGQLVAGQAGRNGSTSFSYRSSSEAGTSAAHEALLAALRQENAALLHDVENLRRVAMDAKADAAKSEQEWRACERKLQLKTVESANATTALEERLRRCSAELAACETARQAAEDRAAALHQEYQAQLEIFAAEHDNASAQQQAQLDATHLTILADDEDLALRDAQAELKALKSQLQQVDQERRALTEALTVTRPQPTSSSSALAPVRMPPLTPPHYQNRRMDDYEAALAALRPLQEDALNELNEYRATHSVPDSLVESLHEENRNLREEMRAAQAEALRLRMTLDRRGHDESRNADVVDAAKELLKTVERAHTGMDQLVNNAESAALLHSSPLALPNALHFFCELLQSLRAVSETFAWTAVRRLGDGSGAAVERPTVTAMRRSTTLITDSVARLVTALTGDWPAQVEQLRSQLEHLTQASQHGHKRAQDCERDILSSAESSDRLRLLADLRGAHVDATLAFASLAAREAARLKSSVERERRETALLRSELAAETALISELRMDKATLKETSEALRGEIDAARSRAAQLESQVVAAELALERTRSASDAECQRLKAVLEREAAAHRQAATESQTLRSSAAAELARHAAVLEERDRTAQALRQQLDDATTRLAHSQAEALAAQREFNARQEAHETALQAAVTQAVARTQAETAAAAAQRCDQLEASHAVAQRAALDRIQGLEREIEQVQSNQAQAAAAQRDRDRSQANTTSASLQAAMDRVHALEQKLQQAQAAAKEAQSLHQQAVEDAHRRVEAAEEETRRAVHAANMAKTTAQKAAAAASAEQLNAKSSAAHRAASADAISSEHLHAEVNALREQVLRQEEELAQAHEDLAAAGMALDAAQEAITSLQRGPPPPSAAVPSSSTLAARAADVSVDRVSNRSRSSSRQMSRLAEMQSVLADVVNERDGLLRQCEALREERDSLLVTVDLDEQQRRVLADTIEQLEARVEQLEASRLARGK